ncbi:gamma-aminobutyric acid receptor subunit pi isoform X2 [Hydra vulgaris]|uniref:Gamma-aminobutyric acid receptor subunit pi isoform X2 n=1 Tax=Hydra vulgaris TaxID=6087 RepID=A0ABM4CEV2_HYDVU
MTPNIYTSIALNYFYVFISFGLNMANKTLSGTQFTIKGSKIFNNEKHSTPPEITFQSVMENYNKIVKPKGMVHVDLDIRVLSFDNLDESSMKYNVDFYFSQLWYDERLKVVPSSPNSCISIVGKNAEDLWLPDTVLVNSKASKFHYVTVENRFTTVNLSSGMILQHARISTTASCHMDLRKYPFDKQTCYIAIESYGHDKTELVYNWLLDESSIDEKFNIAVHDKEMANFYVTSAIKSLEKTRHHEASFSSATAKFTFCRRREYFILQIYLPCALIVAVTWISFWITPTSIPARCGISVTALLTLITMLSITNSRMPKVGYIKALDLYLFTAHIFVFMTLIEYIIVLHWLQNGSKKTISPFDWRLKSNYTSSDIFDKENTQSNGNDNSNRSALFCKLLHKRSAIQNERKNANIKSENLSLIDEGSNFKFQNIKSSLVNREQFEILARDDPNCSNVNIDFVARFVFPISFSCFNILYWLVYFKD